MPLVSRSSVMRLPSGSAINTSPLGATAIQRGLVRLSAKSDIAKPLGACGSAPDGRAIPCDEFSTAAVAYGLGRLEDRMSKCWPGASAADAGAEIQAKPSKTNELTVANDCIGNSRQE